MTLSATFIDLRINTAEQFKESVSEPTPNNKIYLAFGRSMPWANDLSPDTANSSVSTVYSVWDTMIGGKRMFANDMAHVIPRYDWTANTVYVAYDHTNPNIPDGNTQFYVMTSDYNVYKCIANNYGAVSTIKPTTLSSSSVVYQSDGYAWKYMYTVSDADQLRFMTDSYIPVKTLSESDGSLQWQVQSNSSPGSIESIVITDAGINYSNASNIVVTISGDGLYATATATINSTSNIANAIVITNPGSNYTYATVTITDSGAGSGANAKAIISPIGGHGSDPLYELGGKNIMINMRLKYDENGVLPVTNDYRQIVLLKDPFARGTSNAFAAPAFLQAMSITTSGYGDYLQDETVFQGSSVATASFKAKVVSWDSTNNKVVLINTQGSPTAAQTLIGDESFTVRSISSVSQGDLEEFTGRILYVDNFQPITRSSDQIEDYKIVIRF